MKFLLSFFILERFFRPQVVVQMSSKMDSSLLIWGSGIFFSVTIFLSEAFTKSQLRRSIKNPFYTSDWRETLRFFIFFLLLIFSVYLSGFDENNLLFATFVNAIYILFSALLLSVIICKIKSFEFKLIRTLYYHFVRTFFSSVVFFLGIIVLYKWFTCGPSAAFSDIFLNYSDISKYNLRTIVLIVTMIAYLFLIMTSCDLFIEFTKLIYNREKDGTYWTIFYTDPSQEKSVSDITTKEIIKDYEGYYRIPNSNGSGITLMIPISSIVRIDEYKKSSDISIKTGKKKIQKQQRNKSRKPRNLKELMIFFEDENFSLGKSEQRIVQIIQFFYDFSILIFSLVFSRLEIENLRIFIALIMISIFLKVLIQQKISLSLIFKEYFRNLLLIIICNFIAIQITGDSKLATNLIDGIATLCYFLSVLILTAFFFHKADPVKYRFLTFALLIGSILSSFYILIFKERVHELVIAIIISTVVFFFDYSYYRYFGKI